MEVETRLYPSMGHGKHLTQNQKTNLNMRLKHLARLWMFLLIAMAIFVNVHWIPYVIAFIGFAAVSVYMEKHEKRLKRELAFMKEDLTELLEELKDVESMSEEDVKREYQTDSKEEILDLIRADIENIMPEIYDYTPEELEAERQALCKSQGLSRYI